MSSDQKFLTIANLMVAIAIAFRVDVCAGVVTAVLVILVLIVLVSRLK